MKFNVFMTTIATLALVETSAAMMRRYANDSTIVIPTLTGTGTGTGGYETMPTILPTNSSDATASITSSEVFEITTTVVGSTTLSYTLGPEGSSSVVTTIIENTSTITMTSTMYITMTMTRPDEPTLSSVDNDPTATNEPTVTVTNYLTATKTITMENMPTGDSSDSAPNDGSNSDTGLGAGSNGIDDTDGSDTNTGSGPGAFFPSGSSDADAALSTTTPGNLFGGQGGACGVTTVTETIVEKSTVTVTPTGTDNFPIDPTASPTYGFGNGTDPTAGYPTASSGFLTFYKRSQPTKM